MFGTPIAICTSVNRLMNLINYIKHIFIKTEIKGGTNGINILNVKMRKKHKNITT